MMRVSFPQNELTIRTLSKRTNVATFKMVANQPRVCSEIELGDTTAKLSRLYGKRSSYPSVASNHVSLTFWKRKRRLMGCAILEGLKPRILIGVIR